MDDEYALTDDRTFWKNAALDYRNALEDILKLHQPKPGRGRICANCDREWPCPTTKTALRPHG